MGEIIGTMIPPFPAERTGPIIVHPEVIHASPLIADNTVTATQKYSNCWPVITYGALRKHRFIFKLLNPFILRGNRLFKLLNPLILRGTGLFEPGNLFLKPDNLPEDFSSMTAEQLHLFEAQLPSS
jgi:hypothetical protein